MTYTSNETVNGKVYTYENDWHNVLDISVLKGKTITSIEGIESDSEGVVFKCSDGTNYLMFHIHDCCESVLIDDVCGDVEDLIGSEILVAEELNSENEPAKDPESDESFTWTFYKLATRKGYVDIKWYGVSNGYYSEEVDFCKIV